MRTRVEGPLKELRRMNCERVLELLDRQGPLHRAELARRSRLSRTTISTIVSDLLEEGAVHLVTADISQRSSGAASRGRELVARSPTGRVTVGIDFAYEVVRAVVADGVHDILARASANLVPERPWRTTLLQGLSAVDQALHSAGLERSHLVGVGLGVPGPVDHRVGQVGASSNSAAWAGARPADELADRLGVPVSIG